jgi:hypothetical protein
MNRLEIKQRILSGISDNVDDPVFFSDAQLNALIDEAAEFVCAEVRSVRKSVFLPLRAATTFYSLRNLATDIMLPYRLWSNANTSRLSVSSMEELDQFQQRWQDTAATPELWFPVSWDLIGVYPRPIGDGGVLRIDYFAWPEALDDDSDTLANTTDGAVVVFGIYMGLLKQWDATRAAEAFKRLQTNTLFEKGKSGILRIGHRSFGRSNLDLPSTIKE